MRGEGWGVIEHKTLFLPCYACSFKLNITTKKVLAVDLSVKPKNIIHHNPHGDADYSQAALGCHKLVSLPLADNAIPVALLKPASNPQLGFVKHLLPGYELANKRLYH